MFDSSHLLRQNPIIASVSAISANCLGEPNWTVGVVIVLFCVVAWQTAWLLHQGRRFRQRLEQKLHESEQRFYKVFDQAPFVVQLYAPDGTLCQTNKAWEITWNDSRNVLQGYNVLQDAQVEASGHLPYLKRAFAGESVALPPIFYNPAINGHTGRSRWLEGTAYSVRNDAGEVQEVVLVTKDVTAQKQAELALQLNEERLRHVNEALELNVAERTAELAQANSMLQATLEATAEGILVLDNQGRKVNFNTQFVEMWRVPDTVVAALRTGQDKPMAAFALAQLKDPTAFLQATRQMLIQLESETFDILELKDGRVFECYSRPQWLGDRCIGKVLSFRDITRAQGAEAALQLQSQQQTAVIAVQQEIAAISPNLDAVMTLIVDRVQQLTQADGSVIEMVEGDELVYRAANGTAASYVGLRLKLTTSLSGRCIETGEILYCNDTETDPRVDLAVCRRIGIRSMVVVPLFQQAGTIGALKAFSAVPNAFTGQNIQTLQLLAGFLSNTLRLASEFQAKETLLTALQSSEERYASVIAAMAEGIVLQDADGTICASNASAEQILGLAVEQMMKRSSLDPRWCTIHEDGSSFPGEQHPAMVTLRTGQPCSNVIMGICKPDSTLTWVSINAQPLIRPGETLPYAVVTSFTDVTEIKQTEATLQESKRFAESVAENSTSIIYVFDLDTMTNAYSNKDVAEFLGYGLDKIQEMGANFLPSIVHPDDMPYMMSHLEDFKTVKDGEVVEFEMRVKHVSGEWRWLWNRETVFKRRSDGSPYQIMGTAQDITNRRRMEEALRQSEARNRAVVQAVPDLLLRLRRDGFCLDCIVPNQSQAESFLPVYQHIAEVLPPELLQQQLQDIEQAITTGELQVREHQFIKQGKLVHEEVRIAAINDDEALVIVRDITDRKQVEIDLQESQQQLSLALEGSGDGLWDWNIATGEIYLSPRYLAMLGYTADDLPSTLETWESLLHPEDQPRVFDCLNAHLNDPTILYQFEYRVRTQSGEWKWIGNYGKVVAWNEAGEPLRMVGVHRDVNERKQAEIALQQSEIRYRAIVEDQTELIARYLPDGTLTFVNQAYALYFKQSPEEIIGSRYQPIIFEADQERVNQLVASMNVENPVVIIENRVVVGTEVCWTQWHNRMLFDEQGNFIEFQAVGRDITALKQVEETLFQEKELAQVTLQSIGDAVITTDAMGRIEYLNPVAESLTGWSESAAQGLPLVEVFRIIHERTREAVQNPIEQALQENRIVELANHTVLIARNGQEVAIEDSAAPIRNREGHIIGAVMVFHDVTQTRTLARQLSWQASHDALTGLVNRREFERRVEQALRLAKLDFQTHALCYLDLDRFKIVNDTCGHAAGDELLRQVTALLQEQVRKTDTLARLGGDEFGVLLNHCRMEQALRVANELRECVQAFRFVWQEQVFTIGASIGLVGIDADSENFAAIISAADAACYTAKNRGRNRVYMAQMDDQELLQQRGEMQWVSRIAQALETDLFCLYAQPIAAITSTTQNSAHSDHYEVLIRLRDEQGNLVPPMAFIPAAERYNLMHLIDRWVIRTLFRNWATVVGDEQSIYAINLSGSSINDDQFIDFLHEQFALHLISPQRICFEITETVAIANLTKASHFIQELQRLGCRFALDDFGAGMSSFAYLKSLPVNYLKIDGGFIRNIMTNSVDDAIVTAITHIGNVMGIWTIAEFVENSAILERITAIGIDYAQGYGIAEPRPLVVC